MAAAAVMPIKLIEAESAPGAPLPSTVEWFVVVTICVVVSKHYRAGATHRRVARVVTSVRVTDRVGEDGAVRVVGGLVGTADADRLERVPEVAVGDVVGVVPVDQTTGPLNRALGRRGQTGRPD